MRKRKLGSFLLALAMVVSLLAPSVLTMPVRADAATGSSNGMVYNKAATSNGKGGYTITLEAYATGAFFSSEVTEDVPTDIILVLDQSGSMAQNFVKHEESSFKEYTDKTNANLYAKRHNGGAENLYHKLDEDTYVSVSVEATFQGEPTPVNPSSNFNTWLNYGSNLYVKIGGEYKRVEIVHRWSVPAYEYLVDGTQVATGNFSWSGTNFVRNATDDSTFYTFTTDDSKTVYTYYYTDEAGNRYELGTSTGASKSFSDPPLYELIPGGDTTVTRLSALKEAVTQFKNSVADKAKNANVNHRIAVVGFACSNTGSDSNYNNYQNTEIFIGENGYRYGADANANAYKAFQDMSTTAGVNNVTASIGALAADGATYVNHGMQLASTIFANDPLKDEPGRKRVVIVFTDGVPGYSGYESGVASNAIDQANAIRSTYGADVYAVGIFDGADATNGGDASGNDTQKANWFMQHLSNNRGTPQSPSYYLSANDSASLTSIFKQIAENIESGGASTTLGANTVIKDFVSDYFQIPAGTKPSDITVTTVPCTAIANDVPAWGTAVSSGATATVNTETGAVTVTGFDFAANYVGMDTINGKEQLHNPANKLVISFDVVPKKGFLGGNGVPTNASAGIYENSAATDPVITFGKPTVDVPIGTVSVTPAAKNVYLLQNVPAETLKSGAAVTVGGVTLDLSQANNNYGLADWQTAYVDISVVVKDASGTEVTTDLSNLTDDSTYTVSVKVSPKTVGTATEKTGSDQANINVYKPVLTYKDSEVYYGDSVPTDFSGNLVSTVWKHGDILSSSVTMIGDAPTLTTTNTPDSSKIVNGKINTKQDVPVDVSVKIGSVDVARYVTFQHQPCTDRTDTLPTGSEFLLHVKTCTLTITKYGGASDEPYVFTVKKDGAEYTEASITGNGSVTIYELPVGTYSIQEDTDWSWRYTPGYSDDVALSKDVTSGTITCSNTQANSFWLNGFSNVMQNIFGVNH